METKFTTLIERYFDEQLTPAELIDFKKLQDTNPDFQKEVELFEKANRVVTLKRISDVKDRVSRIHQKQTATIQTKNFGWMKIAASIMLLAVVGVGFYAQQFSTHKMYQNAYSPAADYLTNMDSNLSEMEKAMESYNTGNFERAIDAFAAIEAQHPENKITKFYLGQSLLQAGQDEQAIKTLSEVSGDYHPEAMWYAALTQLKIGREADARKTLEHIIIDNEDEAFVLKATTLLAKLNSSWRRFAL